MALETEGEKTTICYPARGSWCATCPTGQCDTEVSGQSEEEFDYSDSTPDDVTSEQFWGFCEPNCFKLQAEELQQSKLAERTVRVMREGARRLTVTHLTQLDIPLYRPDNSSNSSFKQVGSSQLQVWGGTGSCQADPGGPLFVTEGGAATLIGLASGGRDCAANNSRGTFVRLGCSPLYQSFLFLVQSQLLQGLDR